jgi:hypothetical protein
LQHLKKDQKDLTPVAGDPLTWRLREDPAILLQPLFAYQERQPYYFYLDPGGRPAGALSCSDVSASVAAGRGIPLKQCVQLLHNAKHGQAEP